MNMNNIKMFATNEKEQETLMQAAIIYYKDIGI